MAILSDYLKDKIGTHLFYTSSWTKPSTLWVALYTTIPNLAGVGGTEVSGGSYARVEYAPGDANWDYLSNYFTNLQAVTFPSPSANWGTIVGYGILDANTAGNLLFVDNLLSELIVNNGDPAPFFGIGRLKIGIT